MALTSVDFQKDGNDYVSNTVTANADQLVFRIKVDKPGSIILERSITGDDFIPDIGFASQQIPNDTLIIERTVIGLTVGQQIRFRLQECTPESIQVLQE